MAEKLDFEPKDNLQSQSTKESITSILYPVINIILIIAFEFFKIATIDGTLAFDITKWSIEVVILGGVQYTLYSLNFSYSKLKGYENKEYIKARSNCLKASAKLLDSCDFEYLEEYCEHVVSAELERRRTIILALEGINYKKYEEEYRYLNKEQLKALQRKDGMPLFNKKQIKAIRRCNRSKPMTLRANQLLYTDEITPKRRLLPETPEERGRLLHRKKAMIGIILIGVTPVVMIDPIIHFSFGAVVEAILGIVPLAFGVIFGRMHGWNTTVEYGIKYYNAKCSECEQAYNWIKSKYNLKQNIDEAIDT